MRNVSFLRADESVACKSVLIGQPVLSHMKVDTMTLLEQRQAQLSCIICANVKNPSIDVDGSIISRLILSHSLYQPSFPKSQCVYVSGNEKPASEEVANTST